jgi:hypothetical protein
MVRESAWGPAARFVSVHHRSYSSSSLSFFPLPSLNPSSSPLPLLSSSLFLSPSPPHLLLSFPLPPSSPPPSYQSSPFSSLLSSSLLPILPLFLSPLPFIPLGVECIDVIPDDPPVTPPIPYRLDTKPTPLSVQVRTFDLHTLFKLMRHDYNYFNLLYFIFFFVFSVCFFFDFDLNIFNDISLTHYIGGKNTR